LHDDSVQKIVDLVDPLAGLSEEALGDWCLSRNRRNDIVEKGSSQSSEMQIVAYRASCAEAILSVPANT